MINVPPTVPIGTQVTILGQSVDGAHNISRVDTLLMVTGGGSPSIVRFTAPRTGDSAVIGSGIAMSISGKSGTQGEGARMDRAAGGRRLQPGQA